MKVYSYIQCLLSLIVLLIDFPLHSVTPQFRCVGKENHHPVHLYFHYKNIIFQEKNVITVIPMEDKCIDCVLKISFDSP